VASTVNRVRRTGVPFTIILNKSTTAEARLAVSLVSFVVAAAVLHLFWRVRYVEAFHGQWINKQAHTFWDTIEREARGVNWPDRLKPRRQGRVRPLHGGGGMLVVILAASVFFVVASITELSGIWSPLGK
jgi:hypothetical protein